MYLLLAVRGRLLVTIGSRELLGTRVIVVGFKL